jgi:hypothetical protein
VSINYKLAKITALQTATDLDCVKNGQLVAMKSVPETPAERAPTPEPAENGKAPDAFGKLADLDDEGLDRVLALVDKPGPTKRGGGKRREESP